MDFFGSGRLGQSSFQPETLIAYYEGSGTDGRGRHLADILRWGENQLESSHDYIQTLFPLPERSGVNDRAPIIDKHVFEAFRAREDLRDKLRDAFQKMLWFYGFQLEKNEGGAKFTVTRAHNYSRQSQNWLTRFDHNHLRITRILRCLRVLGLEEEALAFYDAISTSAIVSSRSRMYWERAAHRPLNIRPDLDDEVVDEQRIGLRFLRDFERAKKKAVQEDPGTEKGDQSVTATSTGPHKEVPSAEESGKSRKDGVEEDPSIVVNESTRDASNGEKIR